MASQESNNEDVQEEAKGNGNNVGALLRASRLRLGDDLRYVAETLHIRYIYLEAIEDGRFDELPGAAYAIGFIRSYADYLGLDSEEVVRRYKAEGDIESADTELVFPVPIPESSIPGGAIVFVGVVIALLAYGGWYVSTAKDGFLAGLVSPVPERLSEEKTEAEPEMGSEPEVTETAEQTTEPAPGTEEIEQEKTPEATEPAAAESGEEAAETASEQVEQTDSDEPAEVVQETTEPVVAETPQETTVTEEAVQETQETQETTQQVAGETTREVQETTESVVEKVEEATPAEGDDDSAEAESEPVQTEEPSPPEPQETAAADEPTPSSAAAVEDESVSEGQDEADEEPAEEPTEPAASPEETASAPPEASTAPASRVYGAENEKSRILVKARKNSWIQVRDNNANRLVMTRLLRAGDSYRVPDQPGLVLLTGNAGALEIMVDGETVPDLGEAGKVRRNVTLDPDLLRQGTAAE